MHVYGVLLIATAIAVIVRIKKIVYSQPISTIADGLGSARSWYLRFSPLIGFSWWWLWIPAGIAAGYLRLLYPTALILSLVIGIIGFIGSLALYRHGRRSGRYGSIAWEDKVDDAIDAKVMPFLGSHRWTGCLQPLLGPNQNGFNLARFRHHFASG